MHGEHPVEYLRRDEIVERADELDPHDGRFNSPDHKKHQRIKDVQKAEAFVIDGGNPSVKAAPQADAALFPLREMTDRSRSDISEESPDMRSLHRVPDRSVPWPASWIPA